MSALNARDHEKLLAFVSELHQQRTLAEFPRALTQGLSRFIASDFTFYNEVHLRENRNIAQGEPFSSEVIALAPVWEAYLHEHPVIERTSTQSPGPHAISDFLTARQWHRKMLFNEFYRPLNIEDQLSLSLHHNSQVIIAITFTRQNRSFSARDRELLFLLRSHLLLAYKNAVATSRLENELASRNAVLENLDSGVLLLDGDEQVEWMSSSAAQILRLHFGAVRRDVLPAEFKAWLNAHENASLAHASGVLQARRLKSASGKTILLLDESPAKTAQDDISKLKTLGLTLRQSEVLNLLSQGKANQEIAADLKISPHTVKRHLEAIYDVLQVSNRSAASQRAHQLLRANDL